MDLRLKEAVITNDTGTFIGLVGENEALLEQKAANSSNTVLHLAARMGNAEMVTEILKLRPEMVGAENKKLETALHEACRNGNDKVLMLLLAEANLSVTSKLNYENQDALFIACSYGHLNAVNALLDLPWFPGVEDADDVTPLHAAALKGHTDIVRKLIDKRPKLAQKIDKNGCSALHCACSRGHYEVSKLLLRLHPDLAMGYDNNGYTPVHLAAMNGNVEILQDFILTAPTSLQLLSRKQGETVFHLTVRFDKFDAFMCLAKVFSDTQLFHQSDKLGNTVSSLALFGGRGQYVEFISSEARVETNHKNGDDASVHILSAAEEAEPSYIPEDVDIKIMNRSDDQKGRDCTSEIILNATGGTEAHVGENSDLSCIPEDDRQQIRQVAENIKVMDVTAGSSSTMHTIKPLDSMLSDCQGMGASILSAIAEGLQKRALSLAAEKLTLSWGFKKDLKRLTRRLETIQVLLSDTGLQQPQSETIQPWLKKLKVVLLDADKVMDEITYERSDMLRRNVDINVGMTDKVQNFSLKFRLKMVCKIKGINSCFRKVCKASSPIRPAAVELTNRPCVYGSRVDGRDELSPNYLPSPTFKYCLAYCSLFARDSDLMRDELVQLWMALGLLHPPHGSDMTMEDVGNSYFSTMLVNSLFCNEVKDEYGHSKSCQMHDLVQDLAINAAKSYCLTFDRGKMNDFSDILHLRLNSGGEQISAAVKGSCQRLQTLILTNCSIPGSTITDLRCLRVLILQCNVTGGFPISIGELKHLRYLDISKTNIKKLPDSIGKLYNLQTLRLNYVKELPKTFMNLINLRHLYFNECGKKVHFRGIGQLTSLQTLPLFVVNQQGGCKIEELGGLSMLRGRINIYGLSSMTTLNESRKANLCSKSSILNLNLQWSSGAGDLENSAEHVLEGLEPHPNLKELAITNFPGGHFASWMKIPRKSSVVLYNLVVIKLFYCPNCEQIPSLGHLPYLKLIEMTMMFNVKCIGTEFYGYHSGARGDGDATAATMLFPALRTLSLRTMPDLEDWLEPQLPAFTRSLVKVFPFLEKLRIERAQKLITVPAHDFPVLRELIIEDVDNCVAVKMLTNKLTSLTSLCLEWIGGSEFQFVLEELLGNNSSLQELTIKSCRGLLHLDKGFRNLRSLEKLELHSCYHLRSIADIHRLTSLKVLSITDCPKLVSVPVLPCLPSLRE